MLWGIINRLENGIKDPEEQYGLQKEIARTLQGYVLKNLEKHCPEQKTKGHCVHQSDSSSISFETRLFTKLLNEKITTPKRAVDFRDE